MTQQAWLKRVAALFHKSRLERELDEEIRLHLQMAEEENVRRGMTPREARDAAMRSFGGVEQIKEEYRWARGIPWLETLLQDLRYGLRTLLRTPAFTLTALGTLVLGIGATTAVFSVVHAVLLRALPYPEPERLVWVTSIPRATVNQPEVAYHWDFLEWRERARSFSHVTAYSTGSANFADGEGAQRIQTAAVSSDFLSTLGIRPLLGRDFVRPEEEPGRGRVVLLTHAFWQQRFGGEDNVVGRQVILNGNSFTVVGVLPPDFVFPLPIAFDINLLHPLEFDLDFLRERGILRMHWVAARLAPGVTTDAARAELEVLRAQIDERHPSMKERDRAMVVRPLHQQLVGEARTGLLILFGAVACVLWIACLNVANLLLARCAVRRREMAIRGALGAGRVRLARQLLTESGLLAAGGCLAGIVLSVYLSQGLSAIRPVQLHFFDSGLNVPVLAFAVAVSALTAVVFGILPAFTASRTAPMATLRAGVTHVSASRQSRRLLNSLVAGQLSLTLVLLIAAGLMVESFQNLRFRNLGFRTEGVLSAYFSLDRARYGERRQQLAFFEEVLERARALPGVEEAALTAALPPRGMPYCMSALHAEGSAPPEEVVPTPCVPHQAVSPTYFSALGIPLLQGRPFSGRESPSDNVAIVSAAFARVIFGTADPIGKRFRSAGGDEPWRTVIGVAADVRNHGLGTEPGPQVYTPFQADTIASSAHGSLILVTRGRPGSLGPALRRLVHQIDPQQAMADVEPLDLRLTREASLERFLTWVLAAFAFLAVALAAIGVYGVVAYMVQQQRQDIGVRLALGAEPADILRRVLAHGAKLLGAGAALGLTGSLAATRVLESHLFQVSAIDWGTFALASAALAAVAAFACYWPARRASRTDPLSALRYE